MSVYDLANAATSSEVKKLLAKGAKINAATIREGMTALHIACQKGSTQTASALIDNGAEINAITTPKEWAGGWTPLFYAAAKGDNKTVRLLLDKGAKIGFQNRDSGMRTALIIAAWKGKVDTVSLLVEAGADMTQEGDEGTARDYAAKDYAGNATDVIEALDAAALRIAAKDGKLSKVKELLAKSAKANAANDKGITALHYACEEGRTQVASFLISNGAEVEAQDDRGRTPLIYAASYGRNKTVRLLLDKGAKLDHTMKAGSTSIIQAACRGHLETVRFLLDNGADATLKNNDGTARDNAVKHEKLGKYSGDHAAIIAALDAAAAEKVAAEKAAAEKVAAEKAAAEKVAAEKAAREKAAASPTSAMSSLSVAEEGHLLISARFDGGPNETFARDLAAALKAEGVNVYMVSATGGDDFGKQTMRGIAKMSAMLAVCFDDYGAMTDSEYSSYYELKAARDRKKTIVPLRLSEKWPPVPPNDKNEEGMIQNDFVFHSALAYVDGRGMSAEKCARLLLDAAADKLPRRSTQA